MRIHTHVYYIVDYYTGTYVFAVKIDDYGEKTRVFIYALLSFVVFIVVEEFSRRSSLSILHSIIILVVVN